MRRKAIAAAMTTVLLLGSMAGCSNNKEEKKEEETTPSPAATEEVTPSPEAALSFDKTNYSEETKTISTSKGDRTVTYRHYKQICYVANPVDTDYQSMDIKVPVKIDGKEMDASMAPILFANSVGGYLSASNAENAGGNNDSTENIMNNQLALAYGYVVVEPGCRGRDNKAEDGTYYGKAPAAIVDLKAAVCYLKHLDDEIPGNSHRIISTGSGAGGALSALLGVSGDSDLYEDALEELGAADEDDSIYACACFCPITDLQHADMAYEWMFGSVKKDGEKVDQTRSKELADQLKEYLSVLGLQGKNEFGTITASNYKEYLLEYYLQPSATKYLESLGDADRLAYLKKNSWITWKNHQATFHFDQYVDHIGRSKSLPAFDSFDLSSAENILFGDEKTDARHFTEFGIAHTTVKSNDTIDEALQTTINMMNPMYFLTEDDEDCAKYWWIRQGSSDTNTSLPVVINLAVALENQGKEVNTALYWDAVHGANEDPEAFMEWISAITGYSR